MRGFALLRTNEFTYDNFQMFSEPSRRFRDIRVNLYI